MSLIDTLVGFEPLHNLQVSSDRRLFLGTLIAGMSNVFKVVLGGAIFFVDDALLLNCAKLLLFFSLLILIYRLLVFAKECLDSLRLTIGLTERHLEQLVVAHGILHLRLDELVVTLRNVLTRLQLLIVTLLLFKDFVEDERLLLEPFDLLLQFERDSVVLEEAGSLLRFHLEMLELLFDFLHVSLLLQNLSMS